MGKNVVLMTLDDTESEAAAKPRMPRQVLIESVETALSSVREVHGAEELAIIADPTRQLARTTDQIDAFTFKCKDSCGCPMTAAGFAVDRPVNFVALFPELSNPVNTFASAFDSGVADRLPGLLRASGIEAEDEDGYSIAFGDDPMTFTITD